MVKEEQIAEAWWGIVSSMAELHQWELEHHPLLETQTGRHLYYRMAQEAAKEGSSFSRALKDVFGDMHFTDKALRTRMRQMEREGLVQAIPRTDDGRSKQLVPTDLFHKLLRQHAEQIKCIFDRHFLLIEK
jgi:DNA-binding MarR family transcriptional regulator